MVVSEHPYLLQVVNTSTPFHIALEDQTLQALRLVGRYSVGYVSFNVDGLVDDLPLAVVQLLAAVERKCSPSVDSG